MGMRTLEKEVGPVSGQAEGEGYHKSGHHGAQDGDGVHQAGAVLEQQGPPHPKVPPPPRLPQLMPLGEQLAHRLHHHHDLAHHPQESAGVVPTLGARLDGDADLEHRQQHHVLEQPLEHEVLAEGLPLGLDQLPDPGEAEELVPPKRHDVGHGAVRAAVQALWRIAEGCGGVWRGVEGCGGVWRG